ncbi:hypothetical protein PT974_07407 [Cladobotryum mycophilum]|uniref:Uncharacterized protein n=1 Tax=Cladobotryum mycophilum TaxID=491253 RepID=A0ABR0SP63_9HYPO
MALSLYNGLLSLAFLTSLVSANPVPAFQDQDLVNDGLATEHCTTTIESFAAFTHGPTRTIWTTTATSTSLVDCHGCDTLATSYAHFGPGPVVMFSTTITVAEPSITTVFQCGPPLTTTTPSV